MAITFIKVVNGKAKKAFVKVGERRGSVIAILKGLKSGDVVVSVGQMKIHDGSKVTDQGAVLPDSHQYNES